MTPRLRIASSFAIGVAVALVAPVYPWRSETRSWIIGHAGDSIEHSWSLNWFVHLFRLARYHDAPVVPMLANTFLLLLLAGGVAYGVLALWKRG